MSVLGLRSLRLYVCAWKDKDGDFSVVIILWRKFLVEEVINSYDHNRTVLISVSPSTESLPLTVVSLSISIFPLELYRVQITGYLKTKGKE